MEWVGDICDFDTFKALAFRRLGPWLFGEPYAVRRVYYDERGRQEWED